MKGAVSSENLGTWSLNTIFENSDEDSNIYTKNGLFTHLMVLLSGRIAEEVFYGYSVTTGARQDLEQAFSLAKNMILNYGMGKQNIYYVRMRNQWVQDNDISEEVFYAFLPSSNKITV